MSRFRAPAPKTGFRDLTYLSTTEGLKGSRAGSFWAARARLCQESCCVAGAPGEDTQEEKEVERPRPHLAARSTT